MNLLRIPISIAFMAVASLSSLFAQTKSPIDEKVDALVAKMSLEEKVGQMTQVNLNLLVKGDYSNMDGSLDPARVKDAVVKYKVGSILNAINHGYPLATWHQIIKEIQDASKETPNKIPVLYGIDAIHGQTFTLESTLLPHNLALAATRNVEIAKKGAKVTAKEARASGLRWNFAPVLDLGRQPLWPRFPETYGEDPYIVSQMGPAMCKAMEEDGLSSPTAVASCMKHYIGYSAPASGKDRTPAYIPEIVLREYYLPQFKAAVDAGASTLMINSGEINGVPVHSNKYLLTDVLRGELGFKGVAVTDWEDIIRLQDRHHIATSQKECVKIAINAGVDMSMVPHDYKFFDYLLELAKEGGVPMSRIDESVKRILRLKFQLGLFENPYTEPSAVKNFGLPEYSQIALEGAQESIILLKNDPSSKNGNAPILPLPKNKKVLIAGPAANSITTLHGCWSYTWQGADASWYPKSTKSIAKAISDKIGAANVEIISTPNFADASNVNTQQLIEKAKNADYIILA
ncbi:MAG: glycoside hydrolase family 3 protein, partial [Cytophagales bacterium]|nr:glycoside hydrolase family 3 protein [Cytophagales bacterium]